MRKMTYFIHRRPDLTTPWPFRWRKHAALGMTRPFWAGTRKYSQCDPIYDWLPGSANTAHSFDGLGVNWHNAVGPAWMGDDAGVALMRQDERRIFTDLVPNCALLFDETILREGAAPIKVFALCSATTRATDDDFRSTLQLYGDALLSGPEQSHLKRLSLCFTVPSDYTSKSPMTKYDAVIELSFDRIEDASVFYTAASTTDAQHRCGDLAQLNLLLIATAEHVFYDEDANIDQRAHMIDRYLMPA